MKIRNGFVSNSSSSSFILKGFVIPRESINYEEIMKKFDFDYQPIVDEYVEKYSYSDRQDAIRDVYWDKFDNVLTKQHVYVGKGVEAGCNDEDSVMIGEIIEETGECGCDFKYHELDFEMTDMLRDIKEKFNIESPVKIIVTTRCC